MCICMYACLSVFVCLSVCLPACLYVCMYDRTPLPGTNTLTWIIWSHVLISAICRGSRQNLPNTEHVSVVKLIKLHVKDYTISFPLIYTKELISAYKWLKPKRKLPKKICGCRHWIDCTERKEGTWKTIEASNSRFICRCIIRYLKKKESEYLLKHWRWYNGKNFLKSTMTISKR